MQVNSKKIMEFVPKSVAEQTATTAEKQEAVETKPAVKQRLKERARSFTADIYIGGFMAATTVLPFSRMVGMPVGICKTITGVGQLREGMKAQDKHEVWDGALNTMLGSFLISSSMLPMIPSYSLALVGGGMLLGKMVYDHPTELLFTETKNLAMDTGYVIGQGAKAVAQGTWNGIKSAFHKVF